MHPREYLDAKCRRLSKYSTRRFSRSSFSLSSQLASPVHFFSLLTLHLFPPAADVRGLPSASSRPGRRLDVNAPPHACSCLHDCSDTAQAKTGRDRRARATLACVRVEIRVPIVSVGYQNVTRRPDAAALGRAVSILGWPLMLSDREERLINMHVSGAMRVEKR